MSVTALYMHFKYEFEPIVRLADYVLVLETVDEAREVLGAIERDPERARRLAEERELFYRVLYYEPFFFKVVTSDVRPGGYVEIKPEELKLGDYELGHVRFTIETDDFEVEVYHPESTGRYTTKNRMHRVTTWVTRNHWHLTEMFYFEGDVPKFVVYNVAPSGTSPRRCELRFVGFRYVLEPVHYVPERFTVIYVFSVPSR